MKVLAERITMVFCDIEHSTRLVQQLGDAYPSLLDRYRETIRQSLKDHSGREIDTSGDGFFMVFKAAEFAISAVSQMQSKFHSELWATSKELKVRFGIHTGKALPTDTGYAGVEVHAASRICDAAHGGQVIVSGACRSSISEDNLQKIALINLGDYLLKDIKYPTSLYQLNISGINTIFPKPRIKPNEKKVVILPFTASNGGTDYKYVGEGMADDMIIALGRVGGLRVVSRSTAFSMSRQGLDITELGKKYKVDVVMEGRVKLLRDDIILSVELVDASTGLNIWADLFHGKRNEIVRIQDEIIMKVARSLDCPLLPEQVGTINSRQSEVPEAYDYYLKGRRFYFQFSTRGAELAIKMFEKAIEADNYYALAYTGLSAAPATSAVT